MNTHASMNRVYRLIWNETLGAFVPASELSRARGKRSSRVLRSAAVAALALTAWSAFAAEPAPNALPVGGEVTRGSATLNERAGRLDITQSTDRVVIDWQRFDIGRDASVNFLQPSSSSVALNRVWSSDPSAIYGRLSANGQVFLSNPNGVLFGSGARVDVGGLVATSMRIDPNDFMLGLYSLTQGGGSVVNQGEIHAADGGYIALLAPEVRNEGVLSARFGTVALAAGESATLQLSPGAPFSVQVDPATVDVLVENRHLIQAEGGQVILSASAAERLIGAAIPGSSGATGLVSENGAVRLVNVEGTVRASSITVDGGGVGVTRIAGALDATGGEVGGGDILVTGDKVLVDAGATLDASGRNGGSVLIGGDKQGANPDVRNAARVFIDSDASIRADGGDDSSRSGDAGRVIVYSTRHTQVHGDLSARGGASGGNGGFIETSGSFLDVTSVPDATAAVGAGGEWLIDPYNITIQAAGSDTNASGDPDWESTADNAIITTGSIQTALNAGTSVTVTTGSAGAQGGDITVASSITKSAGGDASLTFNAHRDIVVEAPITSSSGALSLTFNADSDDDLAGAVVLNNNLTTLGGNIDFQDGVVIGGSSALAITTAGGAGGNVDFNGQVLIGNTSGVTITTGGGNVAFGSMLDSGNDYTFVNSNQTWNNARTAALSGTGAGVGDTYLAVITSPLEMSRAAATANYSQSWLGGTDSNVEGTWRWIGGPEGLEDGGLGRIISIGNRTAMPALTGYNGYDGGYVNWNAGEPNDFGGGGEDALQLGFGAAGQWNDLPTNSSMLPYVRETNLAASPLTIDAGSGSITFSGNVGANKALGTLTLDTTGNIHLDANTVNVAGGDININAGGDLILGATRSPILYADDGSILLWRNIVKNAGADASLTLRGDNDVIIGNGADIVSSSNRLDVTINSDRDASGGGRIIVASGSAITSNGGDITLRGGSAALTAVSDPTADPATFITTLNATGARGDTTNGIDISGAALNAGGGDIELRGVGDNGHDGVLITSGSTLTTTGTGTIAVHGLGGAASNDSDGVNISGSGALLSTQNGELRVQGLGRGVGNSQGVIVDAAAGATSVGGNVVMRGSVDTTGAANQGIMIHDGSFVRTTGTGNIDMFGRGSGTGAGVGVYVLLNSQIQATGGGDLSITGYGSSVGTGNNNEGVKIDDDSLVEVQTGADADLTLTGYGGTGSSYNIGVNTRIGGIVRMGASAGGQMTVTGTGGGNVTGNWGVLAEGDGVYESLGAAPIVINGIGGTGTDNAGIRVTAGAANRVGSSSMTGDITLRADSMDLQGGGTLTIRSSGNLAIEPYSTGTSIGVGDGATGGLNLNSTELSRLSDGFAQITFGRADGTGAIDVEAATFTDNVRLLNTGAGSAGIDFDGAVNFGANRLWLASAGPVTQSASIAASQLLLSGAGAFTLAHAGNVVTTLAADIVGDLSFNNNGGLTVGSISAGGATYNGVASSAGTALLRAAGATSDLTLQQAVSATGAGTSLQLVAGRNFINSFGAAALDAGTGRWLVWSANPANDTRGGLAYDFKQYGATYGVTSPAQGAGDGFMYSVAPTVTATLTGATSRAYDGTTAATLSGANFGYSGALDGDTIVLSTPTSGTYDNRNAGTGKTVSATSISLTSASNGAATVYGYQLASANASGAIGTITPRTLTAGLTGSTTKEYDGTDAATLASGNYTLTGVLGGETVSLDHPTLGSYDTANVGGGKSVSVSGLALTGADASNYALASNSVAANIGSVTPRALAITANDATRSYGDANPLFGASYSGFAAGESASVLGGSLAFGTTSTPTSNVGTYAITLGGLTSGNYTLSYVPGSLTINPAALTITANDLSKIYGDADPALTYTVGGSGLRNGDALSGFLSAPAGAAATAGAHPIAQGTLVAGSNYALTFLPGTLTVASAPLTITADDQSRDMLMGNPTLTASSSGWRYGDDASLISGLQLSTSATRSSAPGAYAINANGASASNYAITYVPGVLEVMPQSPLADTPQATHMAVNGTVMSAPPVQQATVTLSNNTANIHSNVVNGGIALAGGADASMATSMSTGFLAVEPLAALETQAGSQLTFTLPADTFRHSNPNASVTIAVRLADGSPLPAWLSYDAQSGALVGTPPAGQGDISVVFVARDAEGGEATTALTLRLKK